MLLEIATPVPHSRIYMTRIYMTRIYMTRIYMTRIYMTRIYMTRMCMTRICMSSGCILVVRGARSTIGCSPQRGWRRRRCLPLPPP